MSAYIHQYFVALNLARGRGSWTLIFVSVLCPFNTLRIEVQKCTVAYNMIDIGNKFTSWVSGKNIFVHYTTLGWQGIRTDMPSRNQIKRTNSVLSLYLKSVKKVSQKDMEAAKVAARFTPKRYTHSGIGTYLSASIIELDQMHWHEPFHGSREVQSLMLHDVQTYPNKLKRMNSSPMGLCWNTTQIKVHYCCFGSSRKPCAA